MRRLSVRQALLVAGSGGAGGVAAVLAVAGQTNLATAIIAILVSSALLLLADLRRRDGAHAAKLRRVQSRMDRAEQTLASVEAATRRSARANAGFHGSLGSALASAAATFAESSDRILNAVGQERVSAAARQEELLANLELTPAMVSETTRSIDSLRAHLSPRLDSVARVLADAKQEGREHHRDLRNMARALDYEPVRQIQALMQLTSRMPSSSPPLPVVGGWALQPTALLRLVDLIERTRPHTVVECGSGTSTVWIAHTLRSLGGPRRVVSLEHDADYAEATAAVVRTHGLEQFVDIRHAPLTMVKFLDHDETIWCDPSKLADIDSVDLLLVDGPPEATSDMARLPAVPLLIDRMSDGAYVLLDDAHRPAEQTSVAMWCDAFPSLREEPKTSDRTALLVYRRPA